MLADPLSSRECRHLAKTLGFAGYTTSTNAEPYLRYIISRRNRIGSLEDFLSLFAEIVVLTNTSPPPTVDTIIKYLQSNANHPYFSNCGTHTRQKDVKDTVFLIFGVWCLMERNFIILADQSRPVTWAYHSQQPNVDNEAALDDPTHLSLQTYVETSGLLVAQSVAQNALPGSAQPFHYGTMSSPATTADPNTYYAMSPYESLIVRARALNMSKLSTLAGIRIHWTNCVSRHLLLSTHAGTTYVELFALPCALDRQSRTPKSLEKAGIQQTYMDEVTASYAPMFNPVDISGLHRFFNVFGMRRICWCLSCTSYRLMQREFAALDSEENVTKALFFDPTLRTVSMSSRSEWDQMTFPHLWTRILHLEHALQNAKPWSFWVLFRDRREKLPFWTFLLVLPVLIRYFVANVFRFATIILLLTFLQVILGVVQVIAGFKD
jgi:hypothetical protein